MSECIIITRTGIQYTSMRTNAARFTTEAAEVVAKVVEGEAIHVPSARSYPVLPSGCKGAAGPEAGYIIKVGYSWLKHIPGMIHIDDGIYTYEDYNE